MADDIFTKEDAALEGAQNVMLDDLAGFDGDIGLEQLRSIPGTEDLSDEELTKLWADAQQDGSQSSTGTAAAGTQGTAGSNASTGAGAGTSPSTTAAQQRAWKLYGTDDKEVADFKAMTVEQFLAAKIGYTANKAEQKKTLDELIRVAQYGHLNESRFGTAQQERNTLAKQLETIQPQYQTLQEQQKTLLFALDQYISGNQQPLKSLVEGYARALSTRNAPGQNAAPAAAAPASADDSAGLQVYYERVVPAADSIAKQYNLQRDDVAGLIMQFVNNEPAQFVTAEKLQQIIEYDVPQYIERGHIGTPTAAPNAPVTATVPNAELDALRREIAALKAGQQNAVTDAVRNRNRRLPPSAAGGSSSASGIGANDVGMKNEDTDSAASFKKFLKS